MVANTKNRSKRIAKNTFVLYVRMFFLIIVNLYTSRVILDILGIEDFGIYNLVAGLIVTVSFINTSMSLAVNRYIAYALALDDRDKTREVFSMAVNIHWLIAIVVLVIGESLGLWFVNNVLVIPEARISAANIVYQVSIIAYLLNIIRVPYHADIIANENMNIYAYLSVFEGIAKLLIVFALPFLFFDKLSTYGVLMLGITVITFLGYYLYARKHYDESRYEFYWSKSLFYDMFKYAGYSTFGNLATVVVIQGQSVLLNIFYGPALNAVRGLSVQVNSAVCGFIQGVYTAVNPQITKSYAQQDQYYFKSLIFNSTLFAYYLLFIISLPLFLEIDIVLSLWLKEVPEYTAVFVRLSLINSIIFYFATPTIMGLQATGKVARVHLITGSINLLNVAITYIMWKFLKTEPYVMYMIQILVSCILFMVTMIVQRIQLEIKIGEYIRRVVRPAFFSSLLAVILPVVVYSVLDKNHLSFIIVCVCSLCCSLSSFYFIGVNGTMRNKINDYVLKRIHLR